MQFPTDIIANTPTVTGTASAGGASTITLVAPAVATADFYVGWYIQITAGTAAGDVKRITAYTVGRLATVDSAWSTPTDNTSVYALYYQVYTGAVYSTGDQEMQLITFPDTDRPNIKSTTTSFLNVRAKQAKLDIGSATNPALMFNGATTTGLYYGSSAINSTVSGSLVSSINASGISMAASTAITNAVGSATSPSYTFTGRTDVGLYTSASNTLDIATNGASKLTIGSTTASLSSVISTLTLNATTTSADYSHGALLVSGGVGIGQNCNIHGNCNITGALSAGSFVPPPKTVKTITHVLSPYTVLSTDSVLFCDTTAGNIVLDFPAIASSGVSYTVVKTSNDANTVTLTPSSGESIADGIADSTLVLAAAIQSVFIFSCIPISPLINTWLITV